MSDDHQENVSQKILGRLARIASEDIDGIEDDMRADGKDPEAVRQEGIDFINQLKRKLRCGDD